jgi:hypothetical protein
VPQAFARLLPTLPAVCRSPEAISFAQRHDAVARGRALLPNSRRAFHHMTHVGASWRRTTPSPPSPSPPTAGCMYLDDAEVRVACASTLLVTLQRWMLAPTCLARAPTASITRLWLCLLSHGFAAPDAAPATGTTRGVAIRTPPLPHVYLQRAEDLLCAVPHDLAEPPPPQGADGDGMAPLAALGDGRERAVDAIPSDTHPPAVGPALPLFPLVRTWARWLQDRGE